MRATPPIHLVVVTSIAIGVIGLMGCDYLRLLRPSVLKQLDRDVVRFVNYLPDVDDPNEAILARLPGHGGVGHAERGADGVMRARVRVPRHEFIWRPSIIVMPRGGVLELTITNEDEHVHAAILPSDGDRQYLELPARTAGRARLRLDQPGLYTFDCPVADHAGRGMAGFVIVRGRVPESARLDRPPQPRPDE